MKIYTSENVYDAAIKRFHIIFKEFDHYYFSVSGGKDSSIMLQLAAQEARKIGKSFSVLYIDLEAQYAATIEHIKELIDSTADVVEGWYWCALPLSLRNAVSAIQPKWICWDKKERNKWVREYPEQSNKYQLITEDSLPIEWDWFFRGMEFEEFVLWFAKWFREKNGGKTATGIGIRSDESLNRFRTIINDKKERFKDYGWTTRVHCKSNRLNHYNFFPLYDWRTEDDWTAVAKLDLKFNKIYELMYKNGLSIHEQRLCQPYGDDQRQGLDQFRFLEPETWEKVLNRVEGVNFGNIYCRTSLLGNITSEKPEHMTWEEYAVFLLESIGLYAPEVCDHYHTKIRTFLSWYEKEGVQIKDIPDEADKKLETTKKAASWRRIARAIEKNDFWMSRLSFKETKRDVEQLFELKKKYRNIIRPNDTDNKKLKRIATEMEEMEEMYKKMTNHSKGFYKYLGPIFGSRAVQKETNDRFYDDPEKEWFFHLDQEEKIDAVLSLKGKTIKNIYSVNADELVSLLKMVYSLVDTGIVPKRYQQQYLKAGYMIAYDRNQQKNFVEITGGSHGVLIV